MSATETSLGIGEVVKTLEEEFPDVSVSKIRFLETEGLIEPHRTASGYRRFQPGDLARLRYILRLQRDQFVPLKIIRQRLEHYDPSDGEGSEGPTDPANGADGRPEPDEDLVFLTSVNMSLDELSAASGLDPEDLRELEEYGLIHSNQSNGDTFYDEDDLLVAKIARDFAKYGMEPRHMRMYRAFADRETGLFEQIVLPRSSSGGESERQALKSFTELTRLSRRLKHVLLRSSLREHLNE